MIPDNNPMPCRFTLYTSKNLPKTISDLIVGNYYNIVPLSSICRYIGQMPKDDKQYPECYLFANHAISVYVTREMVERYIKNRYIRWLCPKLSKKETK